MHPNSLLITCGDRSPSSESTSIFNFSVQHSFESESASPLEIETESFKIVVFGHFYCDDCSTIDRSANLQFFKEELSRTRSLPSARAKIAGGLFALFVVDKHKKECVVFGDRLGCMPVYYQLQGDRIVLSTNQLEFRSSADPSEDRLIEFLKYGYLPFADSFFPSVHRLRAGETATITFDPKCALKTEIEYCSPYPPPRERIRNLDEAADRAIRAADRYFARFSQARYLIGLSGGYDSRLLTAYMSDLRPSLLNFGNPQSLEVMLARDVADRIGLELESHRIPVDAVTRYANKLRGWMPIVDSLEDAHVLWLINQVRSKSPDFYLDGFIGDTVLGSCYYYKLGSDLRTIASNLAAFSDYESGLRSLEHYVSIAYEQDRGVGDERLRGVMSPEARRQINARIKAIVEERWDHSYTHEDMVESLTHATRARSLISGGPVGISLIAPCACPFIDHEILDAGLGLAKRLRSGDRLYNAIWRIRFPELADLPRSATGGRPIHGDRIYRLLNLKTSVERRFVFPQVKRLTRGRVDKTEAYFSVDGYVSDERNAGYLRAALEQRSEILPSRIGRALREAFSHRELDSHILLRAASLVDYLDV